MAENSSTGDTSSSELVRPCVRFNPGLSDQRQIFLLDVLRKYNPESVLDIGCGEGALVEAVCRPSFALPVSPDFDVRHGINPGAEAKCAEDVYCSLNIGHIAGLDISEDLLGVASELVKAMDGTIYSQCKEWFFYNRGMITDADNFNRWLRPRPRWSTLEVELWKGGLEHFNPEFRKYDVMLSSEVIEHLPQNVLDCFCPMILGRYAPRVLAITTPGFEFNRLFTAPESEHVDHPSHQSVREGGYLDPTGRTQRVFRHHDHKFEWTRSELREWCTSAGQTWGYKVEISGIGRSTTNDPWERDEPNGPSNKGEAGLFASQTAIFTRVLHIAEMHIRQYESRAIELIQNALGTEGSQRDMLPVLFANHTLQCHANLLSNQPSLSNEVILEAVRKAITESCSLSSPGEADVYDIWNVDAVSLACGGSLDRLYEALETGGINRGVGGSSGGEALDSDRLGDEWMWIEPEKRTRWKRKIRWNHYVVLHNDDSSWKSERMHDTPSFETRGSAWESTTPEPWDDTRGWGETTTGFLTNAEPKNDKGFDGWGHSV